MTIIFANIEAIDQILTALSGFDPNNQFTYTTEENSKLRLLHIMLYPKDNELACSIYRKSTNNDIYMNWYSFALKTWKMETLKILIESAILISSTEELLNEELKHLEKVFREKNHFPKLVICNVMNEVKNNTREVISEIPFPLIIIYQ